MWKATVKVEFFHSEQNNCWLCVAHLKLAEDVIHVFGDVLSIYRKLKQLPTNEAKGAKRKSTISNQLMTQCILQCILPSETELY